MKMNPDEMNEMFQWLAEEMGNLPFGEQLALATALSEFVDKVKPIYAKHKLTEGGSTFFFRL